MFRFINGLHFGAEFEFGVARLGFIVNWLDIGGVRLGFGVNWLDIGGVRLGFVVNWLDVGGVRLGFGADWLGFVVEMFECAFGESITSWKRLYTILDFNLMNFIVIL